MQPKLKPMNRSVALFGTFVLLSFSLAAQPRQRVTQPVEWFGTTSAIKFTSKLGVTIDGQFRFVKSFDNMQHQFRLAFDVYPNKKWMISPIAYVHVWNYIYGEQPAAVVNNEHRVYQQVQYKHATGRFFFTQRFRAEQRFIQYHAGNSTDGFVDEGYTENIEFRIRHRSWANYALNHDKLDPQTWYLASFVEAFMSWGPEKYITYTGKIDQLRLFGGLGYQFSKTGNVQLGPYYQYLVKSKGDKQENNVGVFVQFNYNFDLSKPAQ